MAEPDPMFPSFTDGQIARLMSSGSERHAQPGEIIYDQGDADHGVFVVLDGALEVAAISKVIARGQFTGEVNQLSGRRSLVQCKARDASRLLEISRENLQHIVQTDAELSEIFLRAFLLRRVSLIKT